MERNLLIIGCNGYVSAILANTGEELWRTKLREGLFTSSRGNDVSVLIDGEQVYAGCYGRIYALRASTGEILWANDLKGIGYNEVSLAKQGTSTQFITRVEQATQTNATTIPNSQG
jgi:outer membrane protein assembly factor BamB